MTPRLVPWPRAAAWVIAASVAVVAVLGALVHDVSHSNRVDSAILRLVSDTFPDWLLRQMMHVTDPPLIAGLLTSTVIVALLIRRWDVAVLAAAAPLIAVLLTEEVLKPLVHRSDVLVTAGLGDSESLAYPSGHETGLASLVAVWGLLLLGSGVRRSRKIAGLIVLAAALVVGAVALVGQFFHFATDTVGAVGVALAVTLSVGLLVDQVSAAVNLRRRELAREPG